MAGARKEILFMIAGQNMPSSKFRVLGYLSFLEEAGFGYDIIAGGTDLSKKREILKIAKNYDLIFIQKKLFPGLYLRLLKRENSNIVYDFDDALFALGSGVRALRFPEQALKTAKRRLQLPVRKQRLRACLDAVDHVVVGNSFLADYARSFAKKVSVIPTPVRLSDYPSINKNNGKRIIIGWVGIKGNLFYLEQLREVMVSITDRFPQVEWRVLSDGSYQANDVPIRNVRWDDSTWPEKLSSFDIGLMPLVDDDWSRGKCAYKILQYMAAGIPPVASRVGMNSEVLDDGVTGFLATDHSEWVSAISKLVESRELRERLGKNARLVVEERFSLEACWEKFRAVLTSQLAK